LVRGRKKNPAKERSSPELRFASFPLPLCWRGEGLSRVCDKRPLGAALDSPSPRVRRSVCNFLLDNADVVIDAMLHQDVIDYFFALSLTLLLAGG